MIKKSKRIKTNESLSESLPSIRYVEPDEVFVAVTNARCNKADIYVKEGDYVKCCQKIGLRHASYFEQPIFATCSGTVEGIEKHYHRNGKLIDFIKIKNDQKNVMDEHVFDRSDEEIYSLSKDEITEIIKEEACVGLGGSSFPTYVKFQTNNKIDYLLVNAIECEPLISADYRIMLEEPMRIINGILYTLHAFNCKKAYICIKSKHETAIKIYKELLKLYPSIELKLMHDYYPQGWEVAMIKDALNIKIPTGHLPSEFGVINFNISTIVGIYKALKHNLPVIKRDITISGDGILFPRNFRVLCGTKIKDLIPYCGGYNTDKDKTFIIGGPMMGASVESDDVIITRTVTSIIVLNKKNYIEEPCVRCGSCILSCPTGLKPVEIMSAVKAKDRTLIKELNPLKCIECGLCAYVCTSRINVTDYIRKGKILAKL